MIPRVRTILLLGLPLLFSLGVDAAAQAGRLGGGVAFATPGSPTPARGVRVIAVDAYLQGWETRTDNNGIFVFVLPAGREYRVEAQAPNHITYQTGVGYVRANTDNVINPNPLFLVSSSSSSGGMTGPASDQTATRRERTLTAQQDNFTLEMAARTQGMGTLNVFVWYKDGKKAAKNVKVVAVDSLEQQWGPMIEDKDGSYVLDLPEGKYTVSVVSKGGADHVHEQDVECHVTAKKVTTVTLSLVRRGSSGR